MKKIKLLLIGLILAVGVNAQVWISNDVFTPATFDTISKGTGGNEKIIGQYLYIKFTPAINADSIKNGVIHIDSTFVEMTDKVIRISLTADNDTIYVINGYDFKTKDKDVLEYWFGDLFNNYVKDASGMSYKLNYKPYDNTHNNNGAIILK